MILEGRTTAEAFAKDVLIDQGRKLRYQKRLDIVVVSTINDADQGSVDSILYWHLSRNQSLWVPGGVWSQEVNLKELAEGYHKGWSLRLNLTQYGETYQVQI